MKTLREDIQSHYRRSSMTALDTVFPFIKAINEVVGESIKETSGAVKMVWRTDDNIFFYLKRFINRGDHPGGFRLQAINQLVEST